MKMKKINCLTKQDLYKYLLKDYTERDSFMSLCRYFKFMLDEGNITMVQYHVISNELNDFGDKKVKFYDMNNKCYKRRKHCYYFWPTYDKKSRITYLRNKLREYTPNLKFNQRTL